MKAEYSEEKYLFQDKTREIIGICMEVHRILGCGFLEIVYKDALEYEFRMRGIPYGRERVFVIPYKDTVLPRRYVSDFIVYDNIVLEVKAQQGIADGNYKQVLNYLAVTKCPVGLLVNFGEPSLKFKRMALSKQSENLRNQSA